MCSFLDSPSRALSLFLLVVADDVPQRRGAVLARWLGWSVSFGSLASDTKGQARYELDLHGLPKIRHLQEEHHQCVFFPRMKILLALSLSLYRRSSTSASMEASNKQYCHNQQECWRHARWTSLY